MLRIPSSCDSVHNFLHCTLSFGHGRFWVMFEYPYSAFLTSLPRNSAVNLKIVVREADSMPNDKRNLPIHCSLLRPALNIRSLHEHVSNYVLWFSCKLYITTLAILIVPFLSVSLNIKICILIKNYIKALQLLNEEKRTTKKKK